MRYGTPRQAEAYGLRPGLHPTIAGFSFVTPASGFPKQIMNAFSKDSFVLIWRAHHAMVDRGLVFRLRRAWPAFTVETFALRASLAREPASKWLLHEPTFKRRSPNHNPFI